MNKKILVHTGSTNDMMPNVTKPWSKQMFKQIFPRRYDQEGQEHISLHFMEYLFS